MALNSRFSSDANQSRDEFPAFDLTYRYDDTRSPSELTVYPDSTTVNQTTAWITIDVEYAVPLETIR